jgi:hypothetical protein
MSDPSLFAFALLKASLYTGIGPGILIFYVAFLLVESGTGPYPQTFSKGGER